MSCCTSKCVSFCITILCFILSITCLCLYVYFTEEEKYKFLGEVAVFLLILSYMSYVVHYNIRIDTTTNNSNKPKKSTKVTPTNKEDIYF